MKDCDTCGNEIDNQASSCRFCGAQQQRGGRGKATGTKDCVRTVNIEAGLPIVTDGINKLQSELLRARYSGAKVVRIIHGWGSSGVGGKLREACREFLQRETVSHHIKGFVPGDNYSPNSNAGRDLMRRFPELKASERTDSCNQGITFAEL